MFQSKQSHSRGMGKSHSHRVTLTDIIAEHGSENKYHSWGKGVNKNNLFLFSIARLCKTVQVATSLSLVKYLPSNLCN